MKHYTIVVMAVFCAACFNWACSGTDKQPTNDNDNQSDSTSVRIAVMPTMDCMPLYLAEARGWFEQEGLSVKLVHYTAMMDCDTALERGRVNAAMTDLVRAERLQQQGVALEYLSQTAASWKLLSSKNARIKSLKQLDDKTMGMTRYSATHMMSELMIDSAQLPRERVYQIQVNDVSVRLSMLLAGMIDAAFLPEPQATMAIRHKAVCMVDDSISTLHLGVLAVRKGFSEQNGKQLLKIYDQACDSLNEMSPAHYRDLMVRCFNVNETELDSISETIHFSHAQKPGTGTVERVKRWLSQQFNQQQKPTIEPTERTKK